jgi:hypothetical protein
MPTVEAIRAAEETLRMARITVDLVKPGDVVIIHKARPRELVCSLSFVATIVSTHDTQPDLIYPHDHLWEVTVTLDTGDTEVFRCSGKYRLLLATEGDPEPAS